MPNKTIAQLDPVTRLDDTASIPVYTDSTNRITFGNLSNEVKEELNLSSSFESINDDIERLQGDIQEMSSVIQGIDGTIDNNVLKTLSSSSLNLRTVTLTTPQSAAGSNQTFDTISNITANGTSLAATLQPIKIELPDNIVIAEEVSEENSPGLISWEDYQNFSNKINQITVNGTPTNEDGGLLHLGDNFNAYNAIEKQGTKTVSATLQTYNLPSASEVATSVVQQINNNSTLASSIVDSIKDNQNLAGGLTPNIINIIKTPSTEDNQYPRQLAGALISETSRFTNLSSSVATLVQNNLNSTAFTAKLSTATTAAKGLLSTNYDRHLYRLTHSPFRYMDFSHQVGVPNSSNSTFSAGLFSYSPTISQRVSSEESLNNYTYKAISIQKIASNNPNFSFYGVDLTASGTNCFIRIKNNGTSNASTTGNIAIKVLYANTDLFGNISYVESQGSSSGTITN